MKKIFFLQVFMVFSIEAIPQLNWTNPVQADINNGSNPHLSFSKDGDLFLFYYDQSTDSFILRREYVPGTMLGAEIKITSAAKNMCMHEAEGDTIDLMVAKGTAHWIMQSSDSGMTWQQKGTVNSTSYLALPNYMSGGFTEDGGNLRLVYSYLYYNAVYGEKPQAFQVLRTNGSWGTGTLLKDGDVAGVYENGDTVCILTDRGTYLSTDNGTAYSTLNDGLSMPEQLRAADTDNWSDKIFLLHSYTYGPLGADQNLTFTISPDKGGTWAFPQTFVISGGAEYMFYPKFAVYGDTVAACWLSGQSSIPGVNGYTLLSSVYSFDGGNSWSTIDTVYSCSANQVIPSDYYLRGDVDMGNFYERMVITFTVRLGNNEHVYLSEAQYASPGNMTENSLSEPAVQVYPNPSGSTIHIKGNFASISICDLFGKEVVFSAKKEINLSHLSSGIYYVAVKDRYNRIVKKEKIFHK